MEVISGFFEAIWKLLVSLFSWIFSLFPNISLSIPTNVMEAISKYLSYALFILPKDAVMTALSVTLLCSFSIIIASLIRLLLDLIKIIRG